MDANSNTGTALFYSIEVNAGTPQGAHIVTFNSETYIEGGIEDMLNWLQADLASVDRARTPWLIAQSHKLPWMDSTSQSEIIKLLEAAGVDINFAGHWRVSLERERESARHAGSPTCSSHQPPTIPFLPPYRHYYERYLSYSFASNSPDAVCMSSDNHTYTRCTFPISIVSGAPGDVERNDGCPGDPSLAGVVPTCTSQYGYGTLALHNSTHAFWQFTAKPTPIGEARHGRTPFRLQAGYSDFAWIVRG